MITAPDLFGHIHTIVPCTVEHIDTHFEMIKDVITDESHKSFKGRMAECIEAGSAYALSDGSCFLYYLNSKPFKATGVALYGKNAPHKMLTLFAGIFTKLDDHTFKLEFMLHPGKFMQEYKSILTMTSMKRQVIPGYPLVVRIDELRDKINAIYNKRKIVWVA